MKIMSQKQMAYFAECYGAIDATIDGDEVVATFENLTEVVEFLRTKQIAVYFTAQLDPPVVRPYAATTVRLAPAFGVKWGETRP